MAIQRFRILQRGSAHVDRIENGSSLTLPVKRQFGEGVALSPATTLAFVVKSTIRDWSPKFIRLEGYQADGEKTHRIVGYMEKHPVPWHESIGTIELHIDES